MWKPYTRDDVRPVVSYSHFQDSVLWPKGAQCWLGTDRSFTHFHLIIMALLPVQNPTRQTQLLGQAVVCQLELPHIL